MDTFPTSLDAASPRASRAVLRALDELRRGGAVLLEGGAAPLVVLAAETASADGVADAAAVAGASGGPAILLMSAARAGVLRSIPAAALDEASGGLLTAWLAAPEIGSLAADPIDGNPPGRTALAEQPPEQHAAVPPDGLAAFALLKLTRLLPVALVAACADGAARRAAAHDVLAIDPADVLAHEMRSALALAIVAEAPVPLLDSAEAKLVAFRAPDSAVEHVAIVVGEPGRADAPLVRLHSECFTGDLLGSLRCDCGDQLRGAIRRIAAEGAGIVLYLAQEGRGIGLGNKLRAYGLQDQGLDTLDSNLALGWKADERSFLLAATMLERLGVRRLRLLTNNPDKIAALASFGIRVEGRVALTVEANPVNENYLRTKRRRFGHLSS